MAGRTPERKTNMTTTIKWRVYQAPEGGGQAFCGEFDTQAAAVAHAETSPTGTPESDWETHRAARDGVPVPDAAGVEDDEAVGWYGEGGWHCLVRTVYSAL